jgi:D-alanyl-D-alanine carboxypeptidase
MTRIHHAALRMSLTALLWGFFAYGSSALAQPVVTVNETGIVSVLGNPLAAPLPKACWPKALLKGRDTAFAYLPCSSLDILEPHFRKQVECTLARLKKGGWQPKVFETYRSDARQTALYSYGRTRPGARVTNAKNAITTVHHYGLAVDMIHATKGWNHPKFFYWQGQHAEACGLVSGAFWRTMADPPHLQTGAWQGSPPTWARKLLAKDSLPVIWGIVSNDGLRDKE